MKFTSSALFSATFSALATTISVTNASPLATRDASCGIGGLSGLTVVASADPANQIRWDRFTISTGFIAQGDIAFFSNDQPNSNEIFRANNRGNNNFAFTINEAQSIVVAGNSLREGRQDDPPTLFNIRCHLCFPNTAHGQKVADQCIFTVASGFLTDSPRCMTFTGQETATVLPCDPTERDINQRFNIFAA